MEKIFKIIVHVPVSHGDAVRQAIGAAGGGVVGNYGYCSFTTKGVGRFLPLEGANPHIGAVGKLEEVEEECVEVSWIGQSVLAEVVQAVRAAHPYEEPSIEVIELVRV